MNKKKIAVKRDPPAPAVPVPAKPSVSNRKERRAAGQRGPKIIELAASEQAGLDIDAKLLNEKLQEFRQVQEMFNGLQMEVQNLRGMVTGQVRMILRLKKLNPEKCSWVWDEKSGHLRISPLDV